MSDAPNNERRWVCELWDPLAIKCRATDPRHWGWPGYRCGYVDAAPVPPPAPSRPDTAVCQGHDGLCLECGLEIAADQGPDLSDLAALFAAHYALPLPTSQDNEQWKAVDVARGQILATVARLLDREGGTQ